MPGCRRGVALGYTVHRCGRCEAALEPTPGDPLGVEEVADIVIVGRAVGRETGPIGGAAIIENRVGVAVDRVNRQQHVAREIMVRVVLRQERADGVGLA